MSALDQDPEMETTLAVVTTTLATFHEQMAAVDKIAGVIGARTTRLIRVVLSVLGVSSIIVIFSVIKLTDDMSKMISSMDAMYTHFGGMSKDMNQITHSVKSMGKNIEGIPTIALAMQRMNGDVKGMQETVVGMSRNVHAMEGNILRIDGGVWEMSGRFNSVTGAVNHLNYNVNQMAKPTDMISPLGWMAPP
ncbi:MAG: hypothetical protein HQL88_05025 [Magnetococcales bacterium]|nr:hypothetical protein [Magnetococcales bacterium]